MQTVLKGVFRLSAALPTAALASKKIASRLRIGVLALIASGALAAPAAAQDQGMLQRKAFFEDWSVFVDEAAPQKYCYAATTPKETRASKKNIRRGDVFLLVSSFPSANVDHEISVKLGFPTDPSRPPSLEIDGRRFAMFADQEEAWLENPGSDDNVVAAMKRGATAIIRSTSSRGTRITDTFSLIGFTASVEQARQLCR